MKQNLTLSLNKDLIKKAKVLAAHKETSVTGLLSECLEKLVAEEEGYLAAKERALETLKKGYPLGGKRGAGREALHER